MFLGKTEVFQKQIEEKQLELAPWTEKINAKLASKKVSESEYEILHNRVNSAKLALEDANKKLQDFKNLYADKV